MNQVEYDSDGLIKSIAARRGVTHVKLVQDDKRTAIVTMKNRETLYGLKGTIAFGNCKNFTKGKAAGSADLSTFTEVSWTPAAPKTAKKKSAKRALAKKKAAAPKRAGSTRKAKTSKETRETAKAKPRASSQRESAKSTLNIAVDPDKVSEAAKKRVERAQNPTNRSQWTDHYLLQGLSNAEAAEKVAERKIDETPLKRLKQNTPGRRKQLIALGLISK